MDTSSVFYALSCSIFLFPFAYYFLYKKLTHPIVLFIGVLSFQYLVYVFFQDTYYSELSDYSRLEIFLGLWAFLFGFITVSLLCFLFRRHYKVKVVPNFDYRSKPCFDILDGKVRFFTVFVIFAHLYIGVNNGLNGVYDSFLINVRMEHIANPGKFYFFPHMAIFLQSWFVYSIIHKHKVVSSITYLVLLTFLCALSKLERSAIICFIITLLILKDQLTYDGVPIKVVFYSFSIVFSIFIFVSAQFYTSSSIFDLLFVFLDYFAKNLDTFNRYVIDLTPTYDLSLILGPFAKFFTDNVGLSEVAVDGSFNTYSYLKNLHLFGGVEFVVLFNTLLGFLFSIIYEARYKLNGCLLGFFSFFSCSLFLSFFAYTFSWSNWIYYAISFFVIFRLTNRRRSVYSNSGMDSVSV
ncbi:O-antigen polymerase [Shewanella sp. MF08487]|uniref:O-antigen polymerase n=1 Tax=Shewanella sp. MF08487 TaxID=3434873 RepID=UPI003D7AC7C7